MTSLTTAVSVIGLFLFGFYFLFGLGVAIQLPANRGWQASLLCLLFWPVRLGYLITEFLEKNS